MALLRSEDFKILEYSRMRAHFPVTTLARDLGIRTEKVRRVLRRLEEDGVVHPHYHFCLQRLGLIQFNILLALNSEGFNKLDRLLSVIMSMEKITWCNMFSGDYELGLTIVVRSDEEVDDFFEQLTQKVGNVFSNTLRLKKKRYLTLGQRFLFPQSKAPELYAVYDDAITFSSPDITDIRILNELSKTPLRPLASIARTVGIPLQTMHFRAERLTSANVLMGCSYFPDYEVSGVGCIELYLRMRCVTRTVSERLERYCQQHPHITGFGRFSGGWDFTVRAEGVSQSELMQTRNAVICELGSHIEESMILYPSKIVKSTPGVPGIHINHLMQGQRVNVA